MIRSHFRTSHKAFPTKPLYFPRHLIIVGGDFHCLRFFPFLSVPGLRPSAASQSLATSNPSCAAPLTSSCSLCPTYCPTYLLMLNLLHLLPHLPTHAHSAPLTAPLIYSCPHCPPCYISSGLRPVCRTPHPGQHRCLAGRPRPCLLEKPHPGQSHPKSPAAAAAEPWRRIMGAAGPFGTPKKCFLYSLCGSLCVGAAAACGSSAHIGVCDGGGGCQAWRKRGSGPAGASGICVKEKCS